MTIEHGTIKRGTNKRAHAAGRQLPQHASVASCRYDTTTLEPDSSLLNFGTTGSACPPATERQTTFTFTTPTSGFRSVIESGINPSRPARGGLGL